MYIPDPAPDTLGVDPSIRSASSTIASGLHVAFFEHRTHNAVVLTRQRDQQMQRRQRLMLILLGDGLGLLNGFLSLLGQFVKAKHGYLLSKQEAGASLLDAPAKNFSLLS